MNIAPIIFSLILFIQGPCGGCSGGPGPCAPCCATGCGGGPPPGPGFPIDNYIIFLFLAALVYGIYIIKKRQSKLC